jgi:hypothetical protein
MLVNVDVAGGGLTGHSLVPSTVVSNVKENPGRKRFNHEQE